MTHPFQDNWYPVSLSKGLLAGRAERAVVRGVDFAIWRGADGNARAWENRCPHRGMRLSYGFVRENRLTCLYHGWGYDGEGACVSIPAHPGLTPPKSIKVTRYRCHEAGGLIWVAREGSEEAAPAVSGEWIACQSLKFDCSIEAAEDALVLHRGALLSSGSTKSGQEPSVSVSKAGRGLLTFRADAGFEATCALQPIDDGATIVHLLVKATGTDGDVAPEQRCARWGRYVRSEVKAGAPRSHSAKTENATLVVAS